MSILAAALCLMALTWAGTTRAIQRQRVEASAFDRAVVIEEDQQRGLRHRRRPARYPG